MKREGKEEEFFENSLVPFYWVLIVSWSNTKFSKVISYELYDWQ